MFKTYAVVIISWKGILISTAIMSSNTQSGLFSSNILQIFSTFDNNKKNI